MSERLYVGIDLGGTTIKTGLCDEQGKLLSTLEGPTEAGLGAETVIGNMVKYVYQLVQQYGGNWDQVQGVGAGIPGFISFKEGIVRYSPNLNWNHVPAKKLLEERFGKPVLLDNDANVAALGEVWGGSGAGFSNVVCYTLGTGVGGGLIVNGKLLQGFSGLAGELGHLTVVPDLEAIECNCGLKGCLETVSSATGMIRMGTEAVERGEHTSLALAEKPLTAKDVLDAAKTGDEVALRIVHRAARYLGKSMALVSVVVNPQRFIVGGGVSKAGDILFDAIRKYYVEYAQRSATEGVEIVPAALGNDAGVVGAAGLHLYS